jgi:transcriptional adapter 2-alpha
MNCFLNLQEFDSHTICHSYSIINKLNFPIFVEDWTAEDELLLLEGLEKKGFGNWQDIAEMLGGEKTQEEIAQHYDDIILSGKFRNMPLLSKRN